MDFSKTLGKAQAAQKADKDKNNINGSFDPTALERGAKALKELDNSKNAKQAFEVTKLQEQTKQKEYQAEIERQTTARAEMGARRAQIEGEEKRKTAAHQEEQERRTAQYKTQLESELYQHKLEDQQKQNEEWQAKQHQMFLRQEEIRKQNEMDIEQKKLATLEHQAKLERETAMQRARAEAEARSKQERENVDVRMAEMRNKMAEERKTMTEKWGLIMSGLGNAGHALLTDKAKMMQLVTGLSMLAGGFFVAKNGTRAGFNLWEKKMGRPPLVRETSKWSLNQGITGLFRSTAAKMGLGAGTGPKLDNIVLQKELAERLQWTTNSLVNAKKNGTPFRHLLLHGPPGTGKTLFARTLARQSNLDYAIMSGGDVGPLGKDAVDEVNKLFQWAEGSKKGMILFIDEAEAFLRKGRQAEDGATMSENARNVLSAFLHHTGTETDKFTVVLATNVKNVLDRAVMDRVDESFLFPLPDLDSRKKMLRMFMERHLVAATKTGKSIQIDEEVMTDAYLDDLAVRMDGFSGRQIAKTCLAFQSAVFGSGTNRLSKGLTDAVFEWKLAHIEDDMDTVERKKGEELSKQAGNLGTY